MAHNLALDEYSTLATSVLILKNIPLRIQQGHLLQFLHDLWLPLPQQLIYDYNHEGVFVGSGYATFESAKGASKVKEDLHKRILFGQVLEAHYTLDSSLANCICCGKEELERFQATHRTAECLEKDETDRTFYRKDGIAQHLKHFHDLVVSDEVLSRWRKVVDYSHHDWTCGFCGEELSNWDARATHISQHFREGSNMQHWNSNRRSQVLGSPTNRTNFLSGEDPIPLFDASLWPDLSYHFDFGITMKDTLGVEQAFATEPAQNRLKPSPPHLIQSTGVESELFNGSAASLTVYERSPTPYFELDGGIIPGYL
jgi:hypothetical protein